MKKILHIMEDGTFSIRLYDEVPIEELESADNGLQDLINLDDLTYLFSYVSYTGEINWRPIDFDATQYKGEATLAHPSVAKEIDHALGISRVTIGLAEDTHQILLEMARNSGLNINGLISNILTSFIRRQDIGDFTK